MSRQHFNHCRIPTVFVRAKDRGYPTMHFNVVRQLLRSILTEYVVSSCSFLAGLISQRLMPGLCSRTVLNRKQSGNGNVGRTTANGFQNIVPDHTLF